uniref:Uncharacterized protein n=1 Tax=Odontella aurita TaxID=265563 RepID=A0A7S4JF93_9STRA|mmetsp:Transcript_45541/g.138414  ORF Transcript_45541/g.138414 Transcript_45541/m.138414 type:complete len:251 (+) Transcript_45541:453-1205(+)
MALSYSSLVEYGRGTSASWNFEFFRTRFSDMMTRFLPSSFRERGLSSSSFFFFSGGRSFLGTRRPLFPFFPPGGGAPAPVHDPHPLTTAAAAPSSLPLFLLRDGSSFSLASSFSLSNSASASAADGAAKALRTSSSCVRAATPPPSPPPSFPLEKPAASSPPSSSAEDTTAAGDSVPPSPSGASSVSAAAVAPSPPSPLPELEFDEMTTVSELSGEFLIPIKRSCQLLPRCDLEGLRWQRHQDSRSQGSS